MSMKAQLIAPCGINCRLCYGYIRPKNRCLGCRAPDESKPSSCRSCKIVVCEKRISNGWETCASCDTPCRRLKDLDKRYRAQVSYKRAGKPGCHPGARHGLLFAAAGGGVPLPLLR